LRRIRYWTRTPSPGDWQTPRTTSYNPESLSQIEIRSIDYVPPEERHGTIRDQFTLWFGLNAVVSSVVLGGARSSESRAFKPAGDRSGVSTSPGSSVVAGVVFYLIAMRLPMRASPHPWLIGIP